MKDLYCTICGGKFRDVLKFKLSIGEVAQLTQCQSCNFLTVKDPAWIDGSFGPELNKFDLGAIDRSLIVADFVEVLSHLVTGMRTSSLDWGGGYGLLTRMCRDRGSNMTNYEPFVRPLFSGPAQVYELHYCDLILASEVFLHLTEPLTHLTRLLTYADSVLVTAVVPPHRISTNWWYLMPQTGQHVSFFPIKSLEELASKTNTFLYTDKRFFHLFSRRRLSIFQRTAITWRPLLYFLVFCFQIKRTVFRAGGKSVSLTPSDQHRVEGL